MEAVSGGDPVKASCYVRCTTAAMKTTLQSQREPVAEHSVCAAQSDPLTHSDTVGVQ